MSWSYSLQEPELQIFSFPSSLTIKERERIHEFATNINLHHLTTGTRYHKLTISVNPIEKKEENTRQKIASQLQAVAVTVIPCNENVNDVIKNLLANKMTKGRGRGQKSLCEPSLSTNRYNLRSCEKH